MSCRPSPPFVLPHRSAACVFALDTGRSSPPLLPAPDSPCARCCCACRGAQEAQQRALEALRIRNGGPVDLPQPLEGPGIPDDDDEPPISRHVAGGGGRSLSASHQGYPAYSGHYGQPAPPAYPHNGYYYYQPMPPPRNQSQQAQQQYPQQQHMVYAPQAGGYVSWPGMYPAAMAPAPPGQVIPVPFVLPVQRQTIAGACDRVLGRRRDLGLLRVFEVLNSVPHPLQFARSSARRMSPLHPASRSTLTN